LGSRQAGQVHDQALHRLRRAALFSALHLSVLFFRQNRVKVVFKPTDGAPLPFFTPA
jgi:hypothetical protein